MQKNMQIHELAALSGNPASGNVLAIDTGTVTRKINYTALAKAIVEQYNGSTLAGSAQTVQAAIDALNTSIGETAESIDTQAINQSYGALFPDTFWTKLNLINADCNQNSEVNNPINYTRLYHITTEKILHFDHALTVSTTDATLQVADRIYASDGSFVSTVGWKRTLTIPANAYFRLVFRAQPDDTSVTLDITTSMAKVTFELASKFDDVATELSGIESVMVRHDAQTLTNAQKTQARTNIAAASSSDLSSLEDDLAAANDDIQRIDSAMGYRLIGIPTTGGTRAYIALGQVDGLYLTTHGTSGIWTAFQGFTAADYSGTAAYTSGKINNVPTQLKSSETGYYYRVAFGVDSGTITTEQAADAYAYIYGVRTDATLTQKGIAADAEAVHRALLRPTGIVSIQHGGTDAYPQNTLGLYKQAYRNGLLYWECDVIPTADGSYVLCHDDDICTHALTSDGQVIQSGTVSIKATNLAVLRTYKFGVLTGATPTIVEGFEDETIPTLEEFLLLAKAAGAVPVVEIKFSFGTSATHAQHVTNIVNLIKKYGMIDSAYIIAFANGEYTAQCACEAGIRNIGIIYNNGEATTAAVDTVAGWVANYREQLKDVVYLPSATNLAANPTLVDYAATLDMRCGAWTIQSNLDMNKLTALMDAGTTFYITNLREIGEVARERLGLTR